MTLQSGSGEVTQNEPQVLEPRKKRTGSGGSRRHWLGEN